MSSLLLLRSSLFRFAQLEGIQWYAIGLLVTNAALAGLLVAAQVDLGGPVWVVIALGLVALLAEKQSVHISAHTQVSISALPILFAAVVEGPLASMIVGACALLGDFGR